MFTLISRCLANKLINRKYIDETESDIYSYGIEIIISSVVSLASVMLISIAFHRTLEAMLYLLTYCLIRRFAGGFHASSHTRCIAMFILMYIATAYCSQIIELALIQISFILLISVFLIWAFAPVGNPRNAIDIANIRGLRIKAILLTVFLSIMCVVINLIGDKRDSYMVLMAIVWNVILLLLGKSVNSRKEDKDGEKEDYEKDCMPNNFCGSERDGS